MAEIHARPASDDLEHDAEALWKPSERQEAFLRRVEFDVGFGGAAGGGKTDALQMGGLRDIRFPDVHVAYFRREFPRLQEVMDRAQQRFRRLGATWNEQKKRWTFPSGARYSFHHCKEEKDRFNYLSDEYTTLLFDQLEEFTETIVTFLVTRIRTSVKGRKTRLRTSFNPGGVGHVFIVKRYQIMEHPAGMHPFHDHAGLSRVFVPSRVWDNPHIMHNDPAYVQRLLSIPDPALRKAYLEGDFSVFAGQFFSTWDPLLHTLGADLFTMPDWWEVGGGMDYGMGPSPSTILFACFNQWGMATVYREITLENATARQIAEAINSAARTPRERSMVIQADTQMWNRHPDTGGVSVADMVNEYLAELGCGITLVQANKDRVNGWARVFQFLDPRRPHPENGKPMPWLQIVREACPNLVETFPAQRHDEKKPGDMVKNATDHWVETLRYLLMAREPLSLIPQELLPHPTHRQRISRHTARIMKQAMKRGTAAEAEGLDIYDMPIEGQETVRLEDLTDTPLAEDIWT